MKRVSDFSNCTGCAACVDICPQHAIKMVLNQEGFLYPKIDEKRCNLCGLCFTRCPSANPTYVNEQTPCCIAAMAPQRANSSSGGAFTVLAEETLRQGGYVCGAAWTDNLEVRHIIISKKEDLYKLQKSKYIQSTVSDIYPQIKKLLEQNKKVFFTGTPCQVAGLNAYLNNKYDNLLTADLICHGVPSPKVFKQYLHELPLSSNEKIQSFDFRDKKEGWSYKLLFKAITNKNTYTFSSHYDVFYQSFLKNLSLRKSCGKCPFARLPRQGDITLGDFWKIWDYNPKLDDQEGTSLILINTSKGLAFLAPIKNQFLTYQKMPLKVAIQGNPCLIQSTQEHKERQTFFNNLGKISLQENLDICLGRKYDCGILNFWHTNNFGALLTCYALQEFLQQHGKNTRVINYLPPYWHSRFHGNISEDFSNKYLKLTHLCTNMTELKALNKETRTFICGSDQIWRYRYIKNHGKDVYALNFADTSAKKIAYAASFGTNTFEGTDRDFLSFKYHLSRLHHISVREKDGVDICKQLFNVAATHVLDPVFLVDKVVWENLAKKSTNKETPLLVSYIIDHTTTTEAIISQAERYFHTPNFNFNDAQKHTKQKESVENFLYKIQNCKFFITNSFHGLCMAIIFNKPFICISNKERGSSRFNSIADMLNIQNRIVSSAGEVEHLFQDFDFSTLNNILARQKEFSRQWLLHAINTQTPSLSSDNLLVMLDSLYALSAQSPSSLRIEFVKDIINYPHYLFSYYRYKLLSKITFGEKRVHYQEKYKDLKAKLQHIKRLIRG